MNKRKSIAISLLAMGFMPMDAEDFLTASVPGSTEPIEEEVVHTHTVLFEIGNATALSGDYLPVGLYANKHGILAPVGNRQTYNRAAYFYELAHERQKLEIGADLYLYYNGQDPYYDNQLHLQQLYVKGNWGKYSVQLGSKEEDGEFVPTLSSGNMLWSGNTRPAPTLRFGTDDFVSTFFTAHLLQMKANIWWSKHTDGHLSRIIYSAYETRYAEEGYVSHYYDNITDNRQHAKVENPWFHRKSLFLRTSSDYPLFFTYGLEHAVMYGGTINGEDCSNGSNLFRAMIGASGENGNQFNHALAQDYRLDWRHNRIHIGLYKQHYSDDMDGGLLSTGADGLWGIEITLPKSRWIKKIVTEYLQSTNQGGTVYANDVYTKLEGNQVHRTAGNSNFYHDQHMGSWTHYGMILGNPLFASPLYNDDSYPDMASNMLRAYHLAFSGQLMYCLDYTVKIQHTDSWGTPFAPFGKIRSNTAVLIEADYPINDHWKVRGGIATDSGSLYGNNNGFHLNIQYKL